LILRTPNKQTAFLRCCPWKIGLNSNIYRLRTTMRVKAFKETYTHKHPHTYTHIDIDKWSKVNAGHVLFHLFAWWASNLISIQIRFKIACTMWTHE